LNTPAIQDYFRSITALGRSDVAGVGVMELEFYQRFAQRVRVIAEKEDPSDGVACWSLPSASMIFKPVAVVLTTSVTHDSHFVF